MSATSDREPRGKPLSTPPVVNIESASPTVEAWVSGDFWADVNDVAGGFAAMAEAAVPDVPPAPFPALLAAHRIDGAALLELTPAELRSTFRLSEPRHIGFVLRIIEHERKLLRLQEAAELAPTHAAGGSSPSAMEAAARRHADRATQVVATAASRENTDDAISDELLELPPIESFTFVEAALRKHAPSEEQRLEEEATLAREESQRYLTKNARRTFEPRRLDPRALLPRWVLADDHGLRA